MNNRIFTGKQLWIAGCISTFALLAASLAADEEGFRPLFDGRTLDGWEGDPQYFRVEDESIVAGNLTRAIPHNAFLATRQQFGDFELRLQAKLTGQGDNAGVQFRTRRIPNHHEVSGYQFDVGGRKGALIWGCLYDESRRRTFLAQADAGKLDEVVRLDDWNDLVIRCQGPRIQMWINGYQTVDYTEQDEQIERTGIIALQIHGGPPAEAAYRRIRLKQL